MTFIFLGVLIVDKLLRDQQAGFRPGRSCMDQILSLRQIIEKATEGQRPIIVNFVDFRKAFDCVHRPALWSGRFLNSMEYHRRSSPLFRSYTRRAIVRSELMGMQVGGSRW